MKRVLILSLVTLVFLLFIPGCASTHMTSFKDPSYQGKYFTKLLIMTPTHDFDLRSRVEKIFANNLGKKNINCIPSIDIFPPTKAYTDEEINKGVQDNQIDSVIIINLVDASTSQRYIPKTSYTSGNANVVGNTIYYSENTQTYGGYTLSSLNLKFEVKLHDVSNQKCVWTAQTYTHGAPIDSSSALINNLANVVAVKLLKDGMVQ